jgi:hypothetical protein
MVALDDVGNAQRAVIEIGFGSSVDVTGARSSYTNACG